MVNREFVDVDGEGNLWAWQVVVTLPSPEQASALAIRVNRSIQGCAAEFRREQPDGRASWRLYQESPLRDGLWVYGVYTEPAGGENGTHLFAVGLSGERLTVVDLSHSGTDQDAPYKGFQQAGETAVQRLDG